MQERSSNKYHAERPFDQLPLEAMKRDVKIVLTDLDDTLSTHGKLTWAPYRALWKLRNAGLKIILVTGRPAGWCDHIARFWPVDAVVGENGGFYFYDDGKKLRTHYLYDKTTRRGFREQLKAIRQRILEEVPGAGIASDQNYREYDLAIDFCEDVPALPREQVLKIRDLFLEAGANAKISSIHVNGWFGDFDKLSTTKLCAADLFGIDLATSPENALFCGDSPNDEPMFRFFPYSFGMANVREFLDLMTDHPKFITKAACGDGFAKWWIHCWDDREKYWDE